MRALHFAAVAALAACSPATRSGSTAVPARGFTSDQITVETRGSGPDIVLIHGLAGNIGVWDASAGALASRYRLHLVQIKGFGGEVRTSTDSLVSAPVAREVARYIRERGLKGPALVGHSMGGTIAMMVAARNPGLVSRVMVVDMVPFMGFMFGQPGATVASLTPLADQLRGQLETGTLLDQMVSGMARSDADKAMLLRYADASDRKTVANAMHELILTDLRPELGRIGVPLTVLYVKRDNVPITAEQFDAMYRQAYANASRVTLVRIDDSNHYLQLDQPERFVREVVAFMGR